MNTPTNIQNNTKHERIFTGEVVSTKMKDTVVVSVQSYTKHPKYGKFILRSKRFKAHDAGNTCAMGEIVYIKETHPISKDKHFKVVGKKTVKAVEAEA